MARRLILDTGVLIAAERERLLLARHVSADDDVVLSSITVAELQAGVEFASDEHRQAREAFVLNIVTSLPVEPYGSRAALAHARLLAHVQRSGRHRGAHDLIVAATAIATGRIILTTDRRARFDDLPGVECVVV
ncbi:MAG: hypothetical protein RI885_1647 [Actinomycetota bacterium]